VEKYAVSLNLGMIAALPAALLLYNLELLLGGRWRLPELASEIDLRDLRVVLGISTMRTAQIVSAVVYRALRHDWPEDRPGARLGEPG
jgi:hypothetical protein